LTLAFKVGRLKFLAIRGISMNGRIITFFAAVIVMLMTVPVQAKDIRFSFKNASAVVFSHDTHLAKNKDCKTCHSAIFNLSKKRTFSMAEMEKGLSCGTCHNGKKAFSVATDKDCSKCHRGTPTAITYRISVGNAMFSHDSHVNGKGLGCKSCHKGGPMRRGVNMADMEKGRSCGVCHNGKTAFTAAANCGSCHRGLATKTLKYKSRPVNDAVFSHDFHVQAYKCGDCHTKKFDYRQGSRKTTMADMVKGKSCGSCHNGKTAFAASGDCNKCHVGYKPANLTFKNNRGTIVGYFSHDFHTAAYACSDCHTKTFPYGGGKRMTMKDMQQGKSCGACHDGKTAFAVTSSCAKCHKMQ
jgi:c(7)-type cytochrome triheme protein